MLIMELKQALYFDIRKGAHSVGSNVRDAAAYVLWALARAQDAATLAPYATNMARRLATVALYDREIHMRRAASAAFQEHVGRMVNTRSVPTLFSLSFPDWICAGPLPAWDRRPRKD